MSLDIGSMVASVISGGATGIIGVAVQRVADYFNQKQKNTDAEKQRAHELAMRKQDAEIMVIESQNRLQIAEVDAYSRESVADAQAFAASFATEPMRYSEPSKITGGQSWLFAILDVIRGLVRPGLTAYLAVLSSLIYWQSVKVLTAEGMTLDPERAYALVDEAMGTVLYLFTCCTLWYFGSRNRASEAVARSKVYKG